MATRSLGTILNAGTQKIGGLTSIGGLELSSDTIDVTTLDSSGGYREFINGFKDAGEITVEGFFLGAKDAGQQALYTLFESGASEEFEIVFPTEAGASWEFTGIVTGYSTSADLEDPLAFSGTIKVSGAPTLTTTAA